MALVFFCGRVFGWARLRSGSIVASTGLHMTVNGLVTALMFLKG
jgi:membrane protease YdiL (CAAX protease family)